MSIADRRRVLVNEVAREALDLLSDTEGGGLSRAVIDAMLSVPRERFVPAEQVDRAYLNAPLCIGCDQTISQPLIVALMTHLLAVGEQHTVLEVGTGSGYQAAILSEVVRHVYTVEVIPSLARSAGDRLREYGYDNVTVQVGDGSDGWPTHAPYHGIIVTAATPTVPPALLQQLQNGGRLVIPIGEHSQTQQLTVIEKLADGSCQSREILAVRFVPLTHR